ncbi:MAG: hypothetical protein JWQ17_3328 [Tardiphaga sp.]|jgi:hypothetical protein|nr:hypothetical protein [Tardiphaga sp.]
MTSTSNPSNVPGPWGWPLWPFGPSVASGEFNQPINPGWTFGNLISVTEQNSSAPDTERNIVAAESYGRQLGRLVDAVAELIAELPQSAREKPALDKLVALHHRIEKIKSRSAARRLDHFAKDLVELKHADATEYARVAAKLREALADGNGR